MGCTPSADKLKKIPSANVAVTKTSKQYNSKYYQGLSSPKRQQTSKSIKQSQNIEKQSPRFQNQIINTKNNNQTSKNLRKANITSPQKNNNNIVSLKSVSQLQIHSFIGKPAQDNDYTIEGVQAVTQSHQSNKKLQKNIILKNDRDNANKAKTQQNKQKFKSSNNITILKRQLQQMNQQNFQRITTAKMNF